MSLRGPRITPDVLPEGARAPARHNTGNLVPRALMEKGPRGHPLCRWCHRETPHPHNTFCGPACVHAWKLRADAGYLRGCVYARDHGVCAQCGTDTARLIDELAARVPCVVAGSPYARRIDPILGKHRALLTARRYDLGRSLWAADHIVPVSQGGGQCDLGNIQTLCVPCHKAKSRAEAQKRANDKRRDKARGAVPSPPAKPTRGG